MKFNYRTIINGVLFEPGEYSKDEVIERIMQKSKKTAEEVEQNLYRQGLIEVMPEAKKEIVKEVKTETTKKTVRKKNAGSN